MKPRTIELPSGRKCRFRFGPRCILAASSAMDGRDPEEDPTAETDAGLAGICAGLVEPKVSVSFEPPDGWLSIHDFSVEDITALATELKRQREEVGENVRPFSGPQAAPSG